MDDEMLVKFLLNEVSEGDRELVIKWIAVAPENQRYFSHFQLIWEQSRLLAQSSTADENAAWLRFQDRIAANPGQAIVVPFNKRNSWLKIAAMIIMILSVLSFLYTVLPGRRGPVQLASNGSVIIDTLPDNSVVTLNKNSTLSYEEENGSKKYRKAKLKGEGFFKIYPNKSKPFIVEVDGITVQVVGTSFNIKSFKDSTEIIVETGVVKVSKDLELIILYKGDKIVIPKTGSASKKQRTADQLYNYYRSRQFVCDHTPLWKLIEVLNEAYDSNIIIENKKAANELLTTTFDNEPLDNILSVITQTFNLTVEKRKDKIILK